jgi:hypothetical protein
MAPRTVVLGLDSIEWRVSLAAAAIGLVFALVTAVGWSRNLATTNKVAHVKGKACQAGYHLVKSVNMCEEKVFTSRSAWEIEFVFTLVVALAILFFTLRRKRAGVACFAIFLGLGVGIERGFLFFFLGVWLIVRAYRLQKFGTPTMLGSNRVAKDMAIARKEGRHVTSDVSSTTSSPSRPTPTKPAAPEASKRYTPKKPPRRRR